MRRQPSNAHHQPMRAVLVEQFHAGPVVRDVASPTFTDGEVLLQVSTSSVNAIDGMIAGGMIDGRLPYQLPITLGQDVAGTVVATGPGVTTLEAGDPVFGVHFEVPFHAGTWAEEVAVSASQLAKRPTGLDVATAGALGLAGTAAKLAIDAVDPGPGDTVLISGATGGVGVIAVQLAKAAGATVLATARADQAEFVRQLGADEAIDYAGDLAVEIRKAVDDGVQCVVHLAGDAMSLGAVCVPGARFASTSGHGLAEALEGLEIDVTSVMATPETHVLEALAKEIVAGRLRVPIAGTHALEDASRALDDFRGSLGKIAVALN